MSDCRAACQRSEEECNACLSGGLPKLLARAVDIATVAYNKGKISGAELDSYVSCLDQMGKRWAARFPPR